MSSPKDMSPKDRKWNFKWVYIETCLARVNFLVCRWIKPTHWTNRGGQKRGRIASWRKDIGGSPTNTLQNQTETTCQGSDRINFFAGFSVSWARTHVARNKSPDYQSWLPDAPNCQIHSVDQEIEVICDDLKCISKNPWKCMKPWSVGSWTHGNFYPRRGFPTQKPSAKPLTPKAPDREIAITPRLQVIVETNDFGRNALTFCIGLKNSGPIEMWTKQTQSSSKHHSYE